MRTLMRFKVVASLTISILLLSSCNQPMTTTNEANSYADTLENTPTAIEEITENTPEPILPEEGTQTPTTVQPAATPIVETRLSPEQWREWPVIPELTGREIEIYQRGLSLGNDPTNFSKVGDCQAIKDALMGIFDTTDRYILTDKRAHLQETIDNFTGSFGRDGEAVRGGFNAAAVISPFWANQEVCEPGETPIECEYRLQKPSFVIISLEVWWEGRTVERYKEYMGEIIEFFIDNGVVPILSTKADNVEGDHRINQATAELAYEYHIPLWNFWRAVQGMPNNGLRDEFHISYDAWNVRSFTALEALDAVWRGVREVDGAEAEAASDATETMIDFASLQISPAPQKSQDSLEGERWIFSLEQRSGEVTRSAGVYAFDLSNQTLHQVFDAGYRLEDVDQTGSRLLVSKGNELYLSDQNTELQLLTDKFTGTSRRDSVFWLPNASQLVVITEEGEQQALWLVAPASDEWQLLAEGEIAGIIEPTEDDTIYWYQGTCDTDSICEKNAVWRTQSGNSEQYLDFSEISFSFDAEKVAWVEAEGDNYLMLNVASTDQSLQNYHYFPGNLMIDLVWSPIEESLVLLTATVSDYSGKSSDARVFMVDTPTMSYLEYQNFSGLNPDVYWSADSDEILLVSTLSIEEGYQINLRQSDLTSGLYDTLEGILTIQSEDYIKIDKLFWIIP